MSTATIIPNISNGTFNRSINNNSKSKTTITYSSWNRKESCNYKINDYSVKDQYKVAAARGTLPTYLPTYLSTYLPIYLPTYLPTSRMKEEKLSQRKISFSRASNFTASVQSKNFCGDSDSRFRDSFRRVKFEMDTSEKSKGDSVGVEQCD